MGILAGIQRHTSIRADIDVFAHTTIATTVVVAVVVVAVAVAAAAIRKTVLRQGVAIHVQVLKVQHAVQLNSKGGQRLLMMLGTVTYGGWFS
jgi:hypothetical protein